MAEDMRDMELYGRRCMHGVNVGTPGGFDLMCGFCEDGYTQWWRTLTLPSGTRSR